jgi:hypothetical protein
MNLKQVPIIKIGTPFQRPSWRYHAAINPEIYGLGCYLSRLEADSGFVKRLIVKGIRPTEIYSYPIFFRELAQELTSQQSQQLEKIWNKYYFRNRSHKLSFSEDLVSNIPVSWNVGKVLQLNDEYLRRLILHLFDYQYDDDIAKALEFCLSEDNSEMKRWIGYSIYCGHSDVQIAKRWRLTVGRARAIRLLFFDYSHFPSDIVASWALMRQCAEAGEMDSEDFARYKEIRTMGETGLKFITMGFDALEDTEKRSVERYMSNSTMTNAVELKMSMRTKQDALAYNTLMMNFARLSLFREEVRNKETSLRLMELHIKKAQKDLNIIDDGVFEEDRTLLEEMRKMSMYDNQPKFITYSELDKVN